MVMSTQKQQMIWAAVTSVLLAAPSVLIAQDVDPQRRRIEELEAKVAALEARQANPQDVSTTMESVLRDAQRRSHLLATSGEVTAGYDNGFFIRSGDFLLRPTLLFQFRNITDFRQNTAGGNDEIENGFELRRMQFILQGTAFFKELDYRFQWATDRNSGNLALEDAYVRWMFREPWGVRLGQWKDRVSHEKIITDSRLVTVERSLLDGALGGGYFDRVQGVDLIYGGGVDNKRPWNVEAGLTDGANSKNSDFTGPSSPPTIPDVGAPSNHGFDFGIAGR